MADINKEDVIEFISNMSVLELSELVTEMEEKFGVSAAAPVAMMAAGPGDGAAGGQVEEKTEFDVVLIGHGGRHHKRAPYVLSIARSLARRHGIASFAIDAPGHGDRAVGDAEVLVAGGMESMTNAPYLLPKARGGYRMGNGEVLDSMIYDGLWDPYKNVHMGNCGDLVASKYGFTREDQDAFAAESYRRARAAADSGKFKEEIVAVEIPQRRGDPVLVDADGKQADEPNYEKYLERTNEVGFSYLFPVSGELTGYTFIYRTPAGIAEVPVDYELNGIKLP